jgi:hypothetical protein
VVGATPRPLYPRERPGTHCTGGWVGPRAGLDVYEKSRPHYHANSDLFPLLLTLLSNRSHILMSHLEACVTIIRCLHIIIFVALQSKLGLSRLLEVSRSLTHTVGRTPPNLRSPPRRGRYLRNTQHTQNTYVQALSRDSNLRSQHSSGFRPTP